MIIGPQIRAARALMGWTQFDLEAASGVSEISIKNIERGATDPRFSMLDAIRRALASGGVVFLADGDMRDGGPGVTRDHAKSWGPQSFYWLSSWFFAKAWFA